MGSHEGVNRRGFLGASIIAAGAGRASGPMGDRVEGRGGGRPNRLADLDDNIYTRVLGVRPHLGAHEHISRLGGGRMAPEVLAAMAQANEYFVDMHELNRAAGRRVAELLGAPAALVTAGGFSALMLGAAACLTMGEEDKVEALPHPTWARRECLIQSCQRFGYDRAYRNAGATIVEAPTQAGMEALLGEKTAFIAGLSNAERQGVFAPPFMAQRAPRPAPEMLRMETLFAMGKRAGVPVLVDMASDLPPWGGLRRYLDGGADLVVLSGGKVIGGPQSTGILAGRRDLIEAAFKNATPNDHIGRGMKVGKEEIIGLVVALERFMRQDHAAVEARWDAMARRIVAELQGIPGLTARYEANTGGYHDCDLTWDESVIRLNRTTLQTALREGRPRVELEVIISNDPGTTIWHATARTRVLREGEELLVARRLKQVFSGARVG